MPDYRRNWVPGGTYFFTVNLLERNRDLLVAEIDLLRDSVRRVKRLYPFEIVAWVVLPDHMHCVWTLPPDEADYAKRWRLINPRKAEPFTGSAIWSARMDCLLFVVYFDLADHPSGIRPT
ncbi:hypothetical protein SAMN05216379_103134 [Nitrosomonas eutropha]|uniref:REP-associated tyrosine transposase n=1 Tax=Nitrosomonas eutropha TaxID=916 RepID=UPI00088FCF64|nr:hypothetical protein [Nitrosomonas eutropha]SCX05571.1 hypothetical protein SAMN05216379_103134 [Nitrosomonas eutropha]